MPKEKSAENSNTQQSSVDARGASIRSGGDVYLGPVNNQSVVRDNSVTYTVDHEDNDLIEKVARILIDKFGERRITVGGAISLLLGMVSVGGSVSVRGLPPGAIAPLLYAGIVGIAVGVLLLAAVQYHYESRCSKCNSFYSMKPFGDAVVREVNVKDGLRRTTTSTFRCKNCGEQITKKRNEYIVDEA